MTKCLHCGVPFEVLKNNLKYYVYFPDETYLGPYCCSCQKIKLNQYRNEKDCAVHKSNLDN